jgi:hypothetical protein
MNGIADGYELLEARMERRLICSPNAGFNALA